MQLYPKLITDALATVRYPGTGKNLIEAGMVEDDLRIDGWGLCGCVRWSCCAGREREGHDGGACRDSSRFQSDA